MVNANPPRTVVVTGAAGFIGSHTVDRLLKTGHRVVGVDDLSTGNTDNLLKASRNPAFEFIEKDMMTPGFMESLCQFNVDSIVHLAGLVSVTRGEEEPELNFRLNVKSTQIVAEAARLNQINRIVFASSAAVYGDTPEPPLRETIMEDPVSNYGNAKLVSEMILRQYAKSYGMTTICHRYFNVFGPRQDPSSPYSGVISLFTDRFSSGRPVKIFGDGQQTRDFVSVYDVAAANAHSATHAGLSTGSYNICTGRSRSLIDLVKVLRRQYPGSRPPLFDDPRDGDIRHSLGSPELSARKLGFVARVKFEDAIAELTSTPNVNTPQPV